MSYYNSWARGQCLISSSEEEVDDDITDNNASRTCSMKVETSSLFHPTTRCRTFDQRGYIHLPNFVSDSVVASMKLAMEQMVHKEWMPRTSSSSLSSVETFRTDEKQVDAQGRSDYFLDSATKIHFFAEPYAVEEDKTSSHGSTTTALKEEYYKSNKKITALNKSGHGLHLRPGVFREYTTSTQISQLLRELGYVDPVVPQSMYIFKQGQDIGEREGGGVVTSHQDSTFLYTTPRQTCIGLWLALDDATLDNGCLWVRPESHRESIRRQFVRNPKHFGKSLIYEYPSSEIHASENDNSCGDRGGDNDNDCAVINYAEPQMIFRDLTITTNVAHDVEKRDTVDVITQQQIIDNGIPWEGKVPENSLPIPECPGLYKAGFIPLPCKAGDLLVFAGALDHLSLANYTTKARHTFQLHCVEGEGGGVTWSKENWLQYPHGIPFLSI